LTFKSRTFNIKKIGIYINIRPYLRVLTNPKRSFYQTNWVDSHFKLDIVSKAAPQRGLLGMVMVVPLDGNHLGVPQRISEFIYIYILQRCQRLDCMERR